MALRDARAPADFVRSVRAAMTIGSRPRPSRRSEEVTVSRLVVVALLVSGDGAVASAHCRKPVTDRDAESIYRARVGENPLKGLIIFDDGKYLHVSQPGPTPHFSGHGKTEMVTVTRGGGQPEVQIDKCTREVRVTYSR